MPKTKLDSDLLAAVDLARAALLEVTAADTIGEPAGHEVDESGAVTLFFENTMKGYPGWRWAATVAKAAADAPVTVLEVELLPGEGSLLSPEWVPWSVRLAQYRESQAALEAEQLAAAEAVHELGEDIEDDTEDDVDPDEDILVNDFSDFDDEIDGVDVDDLDEDDEDSDDDFDLDDEHEDLINEEDLEDDLVDDDGSASR